MRTRATHLVAVLATVSLVGCGQDEPLLPADRNEARPAVTDFEIAIDDGFDYVPETITVPAGTPVEVINRASRAHSLTADDAAPADFDTGPIPEGDTAQIVLQEPGRYPYHCRLHPEVMHGLIVVEG